MPNVKEEYVALRQELKPAVDAIAEQGNNLLTIPGVIRISPGYLIEDGEITDTPAVVVEVVPDTPPQNIPPNVGNVRTCIVDAGPDHMLRHNQEELSGPGEDGGGWRLSTALPGEGVEDGGDPFAGPLIDYVPPDEPAVEIDEEMEVVCHASCDTGFRVLSGFFASVKKELFSTIYEFTAEHIMTALLNGLGAPKKFNFIFDSYQKGHTQGEIKQDEVLTKLNAALGNRLDFTWAANARGGKKVTSGYFPMAYHIKVSVRDDEEVWLSSGNWKSSGQPQTDPFAPPLPMSENDFERNHNREWHILMRSASLAAQFKRYIAHDIQQAKVLQRTNPEPLQQKTGTSVWKKANPAHQAKFKKELVVSGRVRALALFTPDKDSYFDTVKNLVANARSSISFINQSLTPKESDETYMDELFLVLRDKARELDNVRIVLRSDYLTAEKVATDLKAFKFPMKKIRFLNNVHTKGIIIDDEVIVIGSHNWTGQGTRENRDASMLFWNSEIIGYFQDLFDYDWNRAFRTIPPPARLAITGTAPPPGYELAAWPADDM